MNDRIPPPDRFCPVLAVNDTPNSNWIIASTGNSQFDGEDWHIVTDRVHASEMIDAEFPTDAKDDAEIIVALINAYRTGRLILAPMPLLEPIDE